MTAALIGQRTPDQLEPLLAAEDVILLPDVSSAIDRIVTPGLTANPVGND